MARPIGGRLAEVFRDTYQAAGLTQADVADQFHDDGWTTIDQPKVSKWARGMERIPLDALPVVERACRLPLGTILRRAGYVDDTAPGVEEAIRSDPGLSATDRDTLLDLYVWLRERSARSEYAAPK